ncbi:UNVERIFIED_ORG: tetratricopeptide (TPR) repeat protein [Arthrobacter sp. UYEF13]
MTAGDSRGPIYRDARDLTPFGSAHMQTPVRELAGSVGGLIHGVLGGRDAALIAVDGEVPRLKLMPGKAAKAVHDAIFSSREPERLIAVGRAYPGWAGLCSVMAGLLAYQHGGYLRGSELLQRGLSIRNDDDANQYAATYLTRVVTRVEVAERIEVPVLFSQESVFLALSHSLRETGQLEAALQTVAGLPPSLPTALARCALAFALGRDKEVVIWTEGLLNSDDLSAALLLLRGRALRRLGAHAQAHDALKEVLRRRKTDAVLRNDALTDRALLVLDNGRKSLNPRDWLRGRPAALETFEVIRKDVDERRLWEQEWDNLDGK